MKTRLWNIFKTTKAIILINIIIENPYESFMRFIKKTDLTGLYNFQRPLV